MPGGQEWLDVILATPDHERHLALHRGHLLYLNEADAAAWQAGAHALLPHVTFTGSARDIRRKVDDLAANGVTELVYQPTGDIRRELASFAEAMGLASTMEASR